MNNNQIIRDLIDDALEILQRIKIDYNSPLGPNTSALIHVVENLNSYIRSSYPRIYNIQEYALTHIVHNKRINAYSFGDLRTTIKILNAIYPHTERKIFISHSSKDEKIIKQFTKDILIAGCGVRPNEIFCTLDNSTIHTGDDFRSEIVRGMKECDFILLMISNNYKESEVCLNEMGAAWTLDNKTILPLVLPDCSFENMGFVYKVKQGASITDKTKLDELYNDICSSYNIAQDWVHFNQCKEDFVNSINVLRKVADSATKSDANAEKVLNSLSDFDKKHLLEWARVEDGECWITESMDGIVVEFENVNYSVSGGREKAEWDLFFERMIELGFADIDRLNSDGSPIYKLKKAAYDYMDTLSR